MSEAGGSPAADAAAPHPDDAASHPDDADAPLRVGLTGGIGSGKSTVADLLARRGAGVIDADELARAATLDPEVVAEIVRAFGPAVVGRGGIDRRALGALVFGDAAARRRLEAIVHPWVRSAAAAQEAALRHRLRPSVIVHDVPLLFEAGLDAGMDATVVVTAPLAERIARTVTRGDLDADAVRARDAAQLPLAEKAARATFVIDNAGPRAALTDQIDTLWQELLVLRSARRHTRRGGSR
jgi:dephospho-CoA kinase